MNALNSIATLKTKIGTSKNANGFRIDTYSETDVFCDVKSITQSEFYAGYGAKLKLVKKIKIDVFDWESSIKVVNGKKVKPSIAVLDDEEFSIVRMYQVNDCQCELSLSEIE